MAVELATGYVSILPSTRGLGKALQKDLAKEMPQAGDKAGRSLGGSLASGLKTSAKVGAVAAGVAAGAAVVSGFKSALNQETAEKTLAGLYGSAKQAESTMKGLQKVASTSPIEYSGYTKAAQSLAYAGVEGNKAIGILKNVGLAITASGGSTENMDSATGAVLKMVNAGKVQLDTLQQLSDAGVPILSGLAEHFDKPMAKVTEMATNGKIGLQDVLSVMENATGSTFKQMKAAGQEASQSFSNQWKIAKDNVSNALGRVMLPAIQKLTPALTKVGQTAPAAIQKMATVVGPVAQTIGTKLAGAFSSIPWGQLGAQIQGAFSAIPWGQIVGKAAGIKDALAPVFAAVKDFGANVSDAIGIVAPAFADIASAIAPMAETVIKVAGKAAFGALVVALRALGPALKTVAGWFAELAEHRTLVQIIAGIAGSITAAVLAVKGMKALHTGVVGSLDKIKTGLGTVRDGITKTKNFLGDAKAGFQLYGEAAKNQMSKATTAVKGYTTSLRTAVATGRTWMVEQTKKLALMAKEAALWVASKVKLVAYTVAQKAAMVATKAWAVAQRALNMVMAANPLGLIITGLILLGSLLVLAYKKSDKFRAIVDKTWAVIKHAVANAWKKWIKPAFEALWKFIQKYLIPIFKTYLRIAKMVWTAIGKAVKWAWQKIIQPAFKAIWNFIQKYLVPVFKAYLRIAKMVWSAIGNAIKWAWQRIIQPAFSAIWRFLKNTLIPIFQTGKRLIGRAFSAIGNSIKLVWRNVIQPAFDALKTGVSKVGEAFEKAKNFIADAWGKIKGIVKKPILGAIDIINTVLIDPLNTVIDKLGGGKKTIGRIPTKGFEEGGYTGRIHRKRVAGVVHGDEQVIKSRSRRRLESSRPGGLDFMNKTGQWPGYAKGGRVRRVMPLAGASFSTYPGHTGVDLNAPNDEGKPVLAAAPGTVSSVASLTTSYGKHVWVNHGGVSAVYAHLSRYGVSPGQKVLAGQQLGNVGSTGNSSGPHLHFEVRPPGTYAGSVAYLQGASTKLGGFTGASGEAQASNWMSKITGAVSSVKDKLAKFPGVMGTVIRGAVGKVTDAATSYVSSKVGSFFGGDGKAPPAMGAGKWGSGGKTPDGARQIARAALIGYGWGGQWSALDSLWTRESGWRWNADNPTSSAYGIPQSLPGSKMASAGADWRTNAATQIKWGLNYIRERYGSPAAAWAHSQSVGWYDKGGWLKPGTTLTRNDTGKPEAVLTDSQWSLLRKWLPGKQDKKDRPVKLKELEKMVTKVLDKYGKKSEKSQRASKWLKAAQKAEKQKQPEPYLSDQQWKALRRWVPGKQRKGARPTNLKQLEAMATKVLDKFGAKSRRYQRTRGLVRDMRFSLSKDQWGKLQKWVPKVSKKRGRPETLAQITRYAAQVRKKFGADSRQFKQAREMRSQARLGGQYTAATWKQIRKQLIPKLGKGGTANTAAQQILALVTKTFGPHSPITRQVDRLAGRVKTTVGRLNTFNASLTKTREAQAELSNTVRDAFRADAFGNGLESLRLTLAANTNDARDFGASLKKATQKGLSGGLLKALAESGDRQTATEISNLSRAQIAALEKQWAARQKATAQVGAQAGQLAYGAEVKRLRASINQQNRVLSNLRADIRQATFAGTKAGIQAKTTAAKAKAKTTRKGKGKKK